MPLWYKDYFELKGTDSGTVLCPIHISKLDINFFFGEDVCLYQDRET